MPIPPTSGVAATRHLLASGVRPRRRESGDRRSDQTTAAAAGRAARATSVLTTGQGRTPVLGLCVPARALPRLDRCDDGLRRSLPLPGAVLEPLPAGLPGEVQGFDPRRLLVAPQPARAPWCLPARVRRHLPEPDAALRAVPARRARVLDLLRDVDAGGRAVADRLGRPDQEGAVPTSARRLLGGRHAGSKK